VRETGNSVPDIYNLYDISSVLGVSIDILTGNSTSSLKTMIAVDGGGSKTEFLLFDEEGRILDKIFLGGCNPNFYGIKECSEILKSGIDSLLYQSPNPCGIYIGCAGFGSGDNANEIKEKLKQYYPHIMISCKSDIFNVVASATEETNCLVGICGTGVIVYSASGDTAKRFGGWGYLLDNGGSGFDIGRDVLRVALSQRENGTCQSRITELCEAKLGGNVYNKYTDIYTKDVSFLASFAPVAFEAYKLGDKDAIEIIERNVSRFFEYINTAHREFKNCDTIVLSGSIITKNDIYLKLLKEKLNGSLNIIVPTLPQVLGACINCAVMCGVQTKKIIENFEKYYFKEN